MEDDHPPLHQFEWKTAKHVKDRRQAIQHELNRLKEERRNNQAKKIWQLTFGAPSKNYDGGVPRALNWTGGTHIPQPRLPVLDIVATQVKAIDAKVHTAAGFTKWLKTNPTYRRQNPPKMMIPKSMMSTYFGRPRPPQPSMFDLLSHKFQRMWIEENECKWQSVVEPIHTGHITMSSATSCCPPLPELQRPKVQKKPWTLPRFQNEVTQLNTK